MHASKEWLLGSFDCAPILQHEQQRCRRAAPLASWDMHGGLTCRANSRIAAGLINTVLPLSQSLVCLCRTSDPEWSL